MCSFPKQRKIKKKLFRLPFFFVCPLLTAHSKAIISFLAFFSIHFNSFLLANAICDERTGLRYAHFARYFPKKKQQHLTIAFSIEYIEHNMNERLMIFMSENENRIK